MALNRMGKPCIMMLHEVLHYPLHVAFMKWWCHKVYSVLNWIHLWKQWI